MSFTDRIGLFPVLLLTGCTSPVVVTGPPAGSVVDSLLSRSAADISAMQYRVHQTGPSAQRPASKTSSKAGTSLNAVTSTATKLTGKPAANPPSSASGAGPANGFVRMDGAAPTLRSALRKIIPPGQTIEFDKGVSADMPELWRWKGNDRWQHVAEKMLAMRDLKITVNEKAHTVKVEKAQRAQAAHEAVPAVSIPAPAATPVKSGPAGTVKATPLPTTGRNPFRQSNEPKVAGSQISTQSKVVHVWKIERGTTLRQGYEQWASKGVCPSDKRKWTVRWDTGTNYPIDYTLTFHAASFEDATAQLFNLWHGAQVPLFVNGYRQQCLVVISDVPPNASPQSSPQE